MPDRPSMEEVWYSYEGTVVALDQLQGLPHSALGALPQFRGLALSEIMEALKIAREEVEGQALVALVGAAEADLRCDLTSRAKGLKRDPLRSQARQLATDTDGNPRLESLIDLWREATSERGHGPGAKLKSLIKRRHWLAHGRYWPDQSGVPVDAGNAYVIIGRFHTEIRKVDPMFPRG